MTKRSSWMPSGLAVLLCAALSFHSHAEQVQTAAEMTTFLSDSLLIEDFEGLSVHGGSLFPIPNPLNAETQLAGQGIHPGVSYLSNTGLNLYGGFVGGEEDVYIRGGNLLTLTFDSPQAGVGFRVIGASSQFTYDYTVTFLSGTEPLGSLAYRFGRSFDFAGWRDTTNGITSVEISVVSASSIPSAIDNVMFGAVLDPDCPSDLNFDGSIDTADLGLLISSFGTADSLSDINGDGVVDTADLGILIAVFDTDCP